MPEPGHPCLSIVGPEIVPPRHSATRKSPERNLMLSIVCDSIEQILFDPDSRQATRDRAWLMGQGHPTVSFREACEFVGLDPDRLRRAVLNP